VLILAVVLGLAAAAVAGCSTSAGGHPSASSPATTAGAGPGAALGPSVSAESAAITAAISAVHEYDALGLQAKLTGSAAGLDFASVISGQELTDNSQLWAFMAAQGMHWVPKHPDRDTILSSSYSVQSGVPTVDLKSCAVLSGTWVNAKGVKSALARRILQTETVQQQQSGRWYVTKTTEKGPKSC
jgi:hypothetical protein